MDKTFAVKTLYYNIFISISYYRILALKCLYCWQWSSPSKLKSKFIYTICVAGFKQFSVYSLYLVKYHNASFFHVDFGNRINLPIGQDICTQHRSDACCRSLERLSNRGEEKCARGECQTCPGWYPRPLAAQCKGSGCHHLPRLAHCPYWGYFWKSFHTLFSSAFHLLLF